MSFNEFVKLSNEEQYDAWEALSIEVGHYQNVYYSFYLYQLWGFYVELKMLKKNSDKIWLEFFASTNRLDPYLQHIDLGCLRKI